MISASDARIRTNVCIGDVRQNMLDELSLRIDEEIREASGSGRSSLTYLWPDHARGVEKERIMTLLKQHGYTLQSSPMKGNSVLIHW